MFHQNTHLSVLFIFYYFSYNFVMIINLGNDSVCEYIKYFLKNKMQFFQNREFKSIKVKAF